MYTGMYKSKGNKNMYMKLIVVAIISFTMGALVVGGQGDGDETRGLELRGACRV